jgi:hypothetical protein
MVRICDFHGKTVATSQNLRGVLTFARKHPVDVVKITALPEHSFRVVFYFHNVHGAHYSGETVWADWRVVCDWLASRKSWSVERINIDPRLFADMHPRLRRIPRLKGTVLECNEKGHAVA